MNIGLPCGGIDEPIGDELLSPACCRVAGWALDAAAPLRAVLITLDDQVIATASPGFARPEIAGRFPGVPHAATCGWQVVLDLRPYPQGHAALGITALTAAGDAVPLATVEIGLRREPGAGCRPRCVFTIVQNEARYLPVWLSYYGRHFHPEDIFVLDHNTTDGSTTGLEGRCNVVQVHHGMSYDSYWIKSTVERFQSFLLQSYQTVLFAEVDEIVMAGPSRYDGLADYIQRMPGAIARCRGFEVVQDRAEPALRFDQPLLKQRAYWHPSPSYSKPLLSRVPLTWYAGFHDTWHPPGPAPDPDLVLVHLHRVDFEYCRARHEAVARRPWNEADVARGHGRQSRIFEAEEFEKWFYEDADYANAPRERIPDVFRKVF